MLKELKKSYGVKDSPEERLSELSGNLLDDRISGILVGFADKLKERKGWIDIITVRAAKEEIKQLLKDYKKGKI
jgi:hypothetical protein